VLSGPTLLHHDGPPGALEEPQLLRHALARLSVGHGTAAADPDVRRPAPARSYRRASVPGQWCARQDKGSTRVQVPVRDVRVLAGWRNQLRHLHRTQWQQGLHEGLSCAGGRWPTSVGPTAARTTPFQPFTLVHPHQVAGVMHAVGRDAVCPQPLPCRRSPLLPVQKLARKADVWVRDPAYSLHRGEDLHAWE
jgi:hypothetical protein